MRSNYYNIQSIQPNVCLVTILSCEMTEVYWKQLMADLEPLSKDVLVCVDFLFRNGFHDRYYKLTSKTSNQVILEPFQIGCQISRIADLFFAENPVYIENSILSRFQKQFYCNRLKRIFGPHK